MGSDPSLTGVYVAIPIALLFLLAHLKVRRRPDLGQFTVIFMAAVMAIVALDFAITSLQAESECVSACGDQRITMVLGAVVVEWVAIAELWKGFRRILTSK